MAKRINTYRAYTATDLKNRATIPDAADITVGTTYVDCVNISTTKISDALELAPAVNAVVALCRHADVNPWSGFGPTLRTVVGGVLTNGLPTMCRLGDFAGYNHDAVAPHFDGTTTETIYIIPNSTVVFDVVANIGEVRYTDIIPNGHNVFGVAFSVWNGATLMGHREKALSSLTDIANFSSAPADRITLTGITSDTDFTCRIEIIDSPDTYDYASPHVICQVPGLEDYTVSVVMMPSNAVSLNAHSHWAFEGTTENFNNIGHVMFEALCHRVNGIRTDVAHVQIIAYVLDETNTKITCDTELYHGGPMNTLSNVNTHVFRDPTDTFDLDNNLLTLGYGYTCVVFVNEHSA